MQKNTKTHNSYTPNASLSGLLCEGCFFRRFLRHTLACVVCGGHIQGMTHFSFGKRESYADDYRFHKVPYGWAVWLVALEVQFCTHFSRLRECAANVMLKTRNSTFQFHMQLEHHFVCPLSKKLQENILTLSIHLAFQH